MLNPLKKFGFPLLLVIIIGVFLFLNHDQDADTTVSEQNKIPETADSFTKEDDETSQSDRVMVDVKGEVEDPGVYDVEPEDRVNDVIDMAGGFTDEAEKTAVNLAQKVQDEMIVMVPKAGAEAAEMGDSTSAEGDKKQIRINEASKDEIEELDGIGPTKAEAIVEYREENGRFESAEDMLNVSGIGEKTLESLEDDILVP